MNIHDLEHWIELDELSSDPVVAVAFKHQKARIQLLDRLRALKQLADIPIPPTHKVNEWLTDLKVAIGELPTDGPEQLQHNTVSGAMCVYELELARQCICRAIAMAPLVRGIRTSTIQDLVTLNKTTKNLANTFAQGWG